MIVLNTIKIHVQEPVLTKLHLNSTWAKYNLSTGTNFHQNESKFNFIKMIVLNAMQIIPWASSLHKKKWEESLKQSNIKTKKNSETLWPKASPLDLYFMFVSGQTFQRYFNLSTEPSFHLLKIIFLHITSGWVKVGWHTDISFLGPPEEGEKQWAKR